MNNPPAFQAYASDTLARADFTLLTAAERGLLFSLWCACWTSGGFPDDTALIARLVGLDPTDARRAYTPGVRGFFEPHPQKRGHLRSASLAAQFADLMRRREERSQTGRRGAQSRWGGGASSSSEGSAEGSRMRGATTSASSSAITAREKSKEEGRRTESSRGEASQHHEAFIDELEAAERETSALDYRRATRGH